ncbi:MAG: YidC/Oxa1 family membrane protein insertase, partial [Francisellaceae bacterium]
MKSNYIRIILILAIVLMGASIYSKWEQEHQPPIQKVTKVNQNIKTQNTNQMEQNNTPIIKNNNNPINLNNSDLISVKTDNYIIKISPEGGSIVDAYLLDYNTSLTDKSPLELLKNGKYIATNGFSSKNFDNKKIVFSSNRKTYTMGNSDDLKVILDAEVNGINIQKVYTFKKDSYTISVNQKVTNTSSDLIS